MLQGEHFAILSTFIKLPFVINTFVLLFLGGRLRQVLLYLASVEMKALSKGTVYALLRKERKCKSLFSYLSTKSYVVGT